MNSADEISVLKEQRCRPCESGTPPLDDNRILALLQRLDGWEREGNYIFKQFPFKNFHQTMAFVNAVAWISHQQGHHPDLAVSFNRCRVSYTTHVIGGLSENDFICAAKIDALLTG